MDAIRSYNERRTGGERAITGDDLRQSIRTRDRYHSQSEGGVYIAPQYREGLERIGVPR